MAEARPVRRRIPPLRSCIVAIVLLGTGAGLTSLASAQTIIKFPIPTDDGYPVAITAGPDGNLWFTEGWGARIGRITPAGVITDFPLLGTDSSAVGMAAGPDGNLWFTDSNAIGRFTPPGGAPSFFTVPPCRAFDSRDTRPLSAGIQTPVPLAGKCGIPTGATAVALNLTVTAATKAGSVRLSAGERPLPLSSTINYSAGQTRANNAVAPLDASGATAVHVSESSGSVHVIFDVSGYFMP
jgi:hypothetical protein